MRRQPATLQVLKVRRRGAHFQTKTVLPRLHWDDHPIEAVTVIAHGVRLVPGVQAKVRAARLELDGTVTIDALLGWLNAQRLDWALSVHESGLIRAKHRRRRITALVEAAVADNLLIVDIRKASWLGIRIPQRLLTAPALPLRHLPNNARIVRAIRDGDLVRFEVELPETAGSFDLAQIRSAIIAGTTLIVF